jgi:hypothetical protein
MYLHARNIVLSSARRGSYPGRLCRLFSLSLLQSLRDNFAILFRLSYYSFPTLDSCVTLQFDAAQSERARTAQVGGRDDAQVTRRCFITAKSRVQSRVASCGRREAEEGFLSPDFFSFPPIIAFLPLLTVL